MGGAALGLAYSGELFALLPVLSSIGLSTIGPALIGAIALFFGVSLILSISFLRSKHIEKKNLKENVGNKKEDIVQEYVVIDPEELRNEQKKIRNFSDKEKEDYFKEAIQGFNQLAITAMVNEKENFECFSIYYAASEGRYDVVKYIVKELKVNINEPCCSKYPPIHYAIILNDTKALKCLVNNGADPTKIRFISEGRIQDAASSPLMIAANRLSKESVAFLLGIEEVRKNINTLDYEGETALTEVFSTNYGIFFQEEKEVR